MRCCAVIAAGVSEACNRLAAQFSFKCDAMRHRTGNVKGVIHIYQEVVTTLEDIWNVDAVEWGEGELTGQQQIEENCDCHRATMYPSI